MAAPEAVLSADEHDRARRFAFERDRKRWAAARVALRVLLGRHTSSPPHTLQFVVDGPGKPRLLDGACVFNLSHSEDRAALVVAAAGNVGIDIEVLRSVPDQKALAQRLFTPAEQQELLRAPVRTQDGLFLTCWTRKEACLKAVGSGLQVEPASFEPGSDPAYRTLQLRSAGRMVSVEVQTLATGPGFVCSVARVVGDGVTRP